MATEVEYVNYKDFVADLEPIENPGVDDVTVVSNSSDGPRTIPANTSALTNVATDSDLTAAASFELQTATGKKKVPANLLAKQSGLETTNGNVTALTTYAQNVAHSIAPEFDPTKPNDAGGYAYYADEIVSNNGATYRFKVNHPSGAWNSAEVDRYVAAQPLQFVLILNDPKYIYAIADKNGVFLFGVKNDGSMEWQKGVPTPIKNFVNSLIDAVVLQVATKEDKVAGKSLVDSIFADGVSVASNQEYSIVFLDSSNRVLFGATADGTFVWQKGVPEHLRKIISDKVDKVTGKSLVDSTFADGVSVASNPEYIKVLMDSLGRVIEGVDAEGYHVFKKGIRWSKDNLTDLQKCLKEYGISSGTGDWSDSATLNVARPKVAVINFSGIAAMPTSKTDDLKAVVEFWDMNGNYFKKPCIINAQGSGSLRLPKKNVSIDLLNEDGSDFVLKIGRWVSQSSFHIKAYYEDITRGLAAVCYDIWDDMLAVDGVKSNAVWKKALIGADVGTAHNLMYSEDNLTKRMDNEPVNHPLGFPCVMFLNGEFYGVFSWQLKKHRDNYAMKKNNNSHIHLDGNGLGYAGFFGGTIDWTGFEVRNPKGLKNMDGTSYDGDNPQEIQAGPVKDAIVRLSLFIENITEVYNEHGADSTQFKNMFEEYFDPQNVCDYIVFSDFISNVDGVDRNWQYITYDGLKWWICPYDLDLCFGYMGNDKLKRPDYSAHFSGTLSSMRSVLGVFFQRTEYANLCKTRWEQLRQHGVFSIENVMNKVMAWVDAVGFGRYEDEYSKWSNCRVNGDPIISEKWELVLDENNRPIYGNSSTYNAETSYAVNDECYFGYNGYMGYLKFKCISLSTGVAPIVAYGIRDSIVRIENWVTVYLGYMDALYDYNNQ